MRRFSYKIRVFLALSIAGVIALFYLVQFVQGRVDLAVFVTVMVLVLATYLLLVMFLLQVQPKISKQAILKPLLSEQIVQAAHDAVIVAGPDGCIQLFNPAAEEIFGYNKTEVIGRPLAMLMPKRLHDAYLGMFANFAKTGKGNFAGKIREVVARRKDGTEFPAELSVSGARMGKQFHAIALLRDISHRKQLEREREEALDQQAEFTSIVAHQLKEPIGVLRWQVELLLEHEGLEQVPALKEDLSEVERVVGNMNEFVNDLLNSSRIDKNKISAKKTSVAVYPFVDQIVRDANAILDEERVHISEAPEEEVFVEADEGLLRQTLSNLIENALKYSKKEKSVDVRIRVDEKHAILEVVDQGIGIPKEERDLIFQKFKRGSNAREQSVEGTGLGLYIAKRFVELMNGTISLQSTLNQGTTFTIRLPLAK